MHKNENFELTLDTSENEINQYSFIYTRQHHIYLNKLNMCTNNSYTLIKLCNFTPCYFKINPMAEIVLINLYRVTSI